MYEFKLPDIGEGLSEAELLEWLVEVGDTVEEGQEIALISTDKVNVDLASPASGTVVEIIGQQGDIIQVGALIMRIDDGSESTAAAENGQTPDRSRPGHTGATVTGSPATPVKAAPAIRRYAAELGVDLAGAIGSGPGGQVMRRDIDALRADLSAQPEAPADFQGRRMKLSAARLSAAKRLSDAHNLQVATTISFEIKADLILRQIQELYDNTEINISPTAVVARGLAEALSRHPHFNATISEADNELLMHNEINLGIAVDTEEGLMVPVIRGIENLGLQAVAEAIDAAAESARRGSLRVEDLQNSTFTLSSTGSLEQAAIVATTPVINYPNAAMLWMSRIRERPRVTDGQLEAGPMMACSLSFDHRYLHGADGMAFINDLDRILTDRNTGA